MKRLILIIFYLFIGSEAFAQDVDSLLLAYSDTVTLTEHPITDMFKFRSNKLIVGRNSKELAGTFDDPSRVLYRYPGVSLTNDQSNAISYRGLPSDLMKWSFYGVETVSPNHLDNAGTLSDQSSISAGGVLGIPLDVINNMTFTANPSGSDVVASMSGNLDFNFDRPSESFYKIGLLGLEAGYQSKAKHKLKSHIRYSTVGLLSDLGVNFDGESIKFYDGFFQLNPFENATAFISIGRSTNQKLSQADVVDNPRFEDIQNVDYQSEYIIAGLNYKNKSFNHSLVYSQKDSRRESSLNDSFSVFRPYLNNYDQFIRKFGYHVNWNRSLDSWKFKVGNIFLGHDAETQLTSFSNQELLPYISADHLRSIGDNSFYLKTNVGYSFRSSDIPYYLDAGINLGIHAFSFAYSRKFTRPDISSVANNQDLNSRDISFTWKMQTKRFSALVRLYDLDAEIQDVFYGMFLNGLPVGFTEEQRTNFLSLFNINDQFKSRGIELMLENRFKSGLYINANLSIFDAEYDNFPSEPLNNFGHILNVIISKSFEFKNNKELNLSLVFHNRGGAYQHLFTFEDFNSLTFRTQQLNEYFRSDLRLEYIWRNKNRLILDIQNLTNRQNDAYQYLDPIQSDIVLEKQLGMIPLLSYRRTL